MILVFEFFGQPVAHERRWFVARYSESSFRFRRLPLSLSFALRVPGLPECKDPDYPILPMAATNWGTADRRRFLHVVYRVGDLDKTINFYTECLGMKLLRKRDIPSEKYTNAFLGYGPEDAHFVIELTYNYGVEKYNLGTAFGYFGVVVKDVKAAVALIKSKGGIVSTDSEEVTTSAFVEDPDGYKFCLTQMGPIPDPFHLVMLNVGDLDRASKFYEDAFGMQLYRIDEKADGKSKTAYLGYGDDAKKTTLLGLTSNHGVTDYDKGNAYAQIAVGTDDVYKTAALLKECGGKVTREPGPLPGINTKITAVLDPDGWKTVFVDNADFLKELD